MAQAATALGILLLRCDGVAMRTNVTIDDDVLAMARRGFRNEPAGMDGGDSSVFAVPPDAEPITSEDVYRALRD